MDRSLCIDLIHRTRSILNAIQTTTQSSRGKFMDRELGEAFYTTVTGDIEKIDLLLNGFLNYIKSTSPVIRRDTVNILIDEAAKKNQIRLEERKIRVFKKFEKDLPETIVHEEQLKYILNTLIQYAIPSIPPNGSMGLLTKSLRSSLRAAVGQKASQEDGIYVEILIVFTGYRKPIEQFENILGIPALQKEEAMELELRLIRDIIRKNQGMMKFEVNERKPRTLISLKFPIERRKLVYYRPGNV